MSDKVIQFERRKINEWPREVYLADFDGTGEAKPYRFIQHPDDTTPLYVRYDTIDARIAEAVAKERERCARLADPPLAHRKGKPGLWRQRRAAIAAAIRQTEGDG